MSWVSGYYTGVGVCTLLTIDIPGGEAGTVQVTGWCVSAERRRASHRRRANASGAQGVHVPPFPVAATAQQQGLGARVQDNQLLAAVCCRTPAADAHLRGSMM